MSGPSKPRSSSCSTILKRPATLPIPTCTLMGTPMSLASSQSCLTTSGVQNPGPRVPMARVMSPSSDEKYLSLTRRMSSGDSRTLLNHQSASEVLGKPQQYTALVPSSCRARIASSACSGVLLMCDQSRSVVTPESMASSVPRRLPAYTSSGRKAGAKASRISAKYPSSVTSGAMPRTTVSQVCRCESTKPGITMAPVASMTSQSDASMDGATSAISSSSTSTSPPAISPISGSIEMMWPPRSKVRAGIGIPTFQSWAGWCGLVASLGSGPRGGHRRLQDDVEVAGVERGVEPAAPRFLGNVMPGERPHEIRLHGADGVVIQVWIVRKEDLRDEGLVSFGRHLEMYVRRAPRVLAGHH